MSLNICDLALEDWIKSSGCIIFTKLIALLYKMLEICRIHSILYSYEKLVELCVNQS